MSTRIVHVEVNKRLIVCCAFMSISISYLVSDCAAVTYLIPYTIDLAFHSLKHGWIQK